MCLCFSGFDGKGDIPGFIIILSSFLYMTYYFLDNIDGKQARRTQSSSPLGLLMDHGCDALTTFLFSMSIGSILKLEGPFWYSIIWLMTSITFFFATWEEYQTDTMDLPLINGVDEGAFLAFFVMMMTGFLGQGFWLSTIGMFGQQVQINHIVVTTFLLLSFSFVSISIIKALKHQKTVKVKDALINTIVFLYLVFALLVTALYAESSLVIYYPKLIIYTFGFCFAKLVVNIYIII